MEVIIILIAAVILLSLLAARLGASGNVPDRTPSRPDRSDLGVGPQTGHGGAGHSDGGGD